MESIVKKACILILHEDRFFSLSKKPNDEGIISAMFSEAMTAAIADRIESSKIVQVTQFSDKGLFLLQPLHFYQIDKMVEILEDILLNF